MPQISPLFTLLLLLPLLAAATECGPGNHFKHGHCRPCPPGTFQTESNATTCKNCNFTQYTLGAGSTACLDCPPTLHRTYNKTACECGGGKALNSTTQQCQVVCSPGYVYSGIRAGCGVCRPGTYKPLKGPGPCLPCPTGEFSPYAASSCWRCPPGQGLLIFPSMKCGTCPPGKYYLETTCAKCSMNMFKPDEGIHSCQSCGPDTYSDPGAIRCERCPPGTARLRDNTCGTCQPGYYYNRVNRMCFGCRAGWFSNVTNVLHRCERCPEGSWSLPGSNRCVSCPQGTHLFRNYTCRSCPRGTRYTSPTYTSPIYDCTGCSWNKYLDEKTGRCRQCPNGKFSRPNSDACFTCPPAQALIRSTGQCGSCPPGETYKWHSVVCRPCSPLFIKPDWGLQACTECPTGTGPNSEHTVCVAQRT